MYFKDFSQIEPLAKTQNASLFVLPSGTDLSPFFKTAPRFVPQAEKSEISIDQIRALTALASLRYHKDHFFVLAPAEAMNLAAANAFLKTLETPHPYVHFVLFSFKPNLVLPTIRSRVAQFFLRSKVDLSQAPSGLSAQELALARTFISGSQAQRLALVNKIAKQKDKNLRAAQLLDHAIKLCYHAYFATANLRFLALLPGLMQAYDAISHTNANVRLQLLASML